jgi:hypothetical protein
MIQIRFGRFGEAGCAEAGNQARAAIQNNDAKRDRIMVVRDRVMVVRDRVMVVDVGIEDVGIERVDCQVILLPGDACMVVGYRECASSRYRLEAGVPY